MRIQNTYNVTNNNFVRALMNSISMQAVYHNNVVGQGKTVLNKSVLPRKSLQIVSEVNVTFDGNVDEGGDLLLVSIMCDPKGHVTVHHLYLDFQVTLNTHFLAHKEEFTLASSNFSNCVKQKNNSKLLSGMFEVST
uniref:Uncharacterized protein LOC102803291 n=1 Tax=Saccoglossus kowalevskii TaxID=10224 RepID=A0ABM0M236_SACKO|nr:PREDICTED: uncharacterized protein LOC102803291 [Saccoglossus kowalevskii]